MFKVDFKPLNYSFSVGTMEGKEGEKRDQRKKKKKKKETGRGRKRGGKKDKLDC